MIVVDEETGEEVVVDNFSIVSEEIGKIEKKDDTAEA